MIKKPNEFNYTEEQKDEINSTPAFYRQDRIRNIQDEIINNEEDERERRRIADKICAAIIQFFNETNMNNLKLPRSYEVAFIYDEYLNDFRKILKLMLVDRKYLESLSVDERSKKLLNFITVDTVKLYVTLDIICLNINLQRYKK